MKQAASALMIFSVLALIFACGPLKSEPELSKRICGVTDRDPLETLAYWDSSRGHPRKPGPLGRFDSSIGQTADEGELYEALSECVFNEGRDLAASGESFDIIYVAEKARCSMFQDKLERWGYDRYLKSASPDLRASREEWLAGQEQNLRKDALTSFVADRAGKCWEHPHYFSK